MVWVWVFVCGVVQRTPLWGLTACRTHKACGHEHYSNTSWSQTAREHPDKSRTQDVTPHISQNTIHTHLWEEASLVSDDVEGQQGGEVDGGQRVDLGLRAPVVVDRVGL